MTVTVTTRELADGFLDLVGGVRHRGSAGSLLSSEVVYAVPGRGPAAGTHRGLDAVLSALTATPRPGVKPTGHRVTETIVQDQRAVVIIETSGIDDDTPFRFETAFHLECRDGRIVGITEYSGDQYTADRIVGPAGPGDNGHTSP